MNTLTAKALKGSKSTAKQATKFASDEAFEFIKTGKSQVAGSGTEKPASGNAQQKPVQDEMATQSASEEELARLKAQSKRQIEVLEQEIADIVRQKEERDRQVKLAEEAQKKRAAEAEESTGLSEPSTKRKRGVLGGMKGKVDRMKRKSEIGKSPSG